jgi:hypothetical protein
MACDYKGATIILPTKHAKSLGIAPPFWKHLQASVMECVVDTDSLGTFSGEIERKGNALECARRKCEWALELLGEKADYFLSSEGSFGPHAAIPFLANDQEILYFIDRKRGFHLHLVHASEKTNYQTKMIHSLNELRAFARSAEFPSHALVLRPNDRSMKNMIFKGIADQAWLIDAFKKVQDASRDRGVWVETDMRANCNPSRMAVIGELAEKLAKRLTSLCPLCCTPGWGIVNAEKGLRCEYCNQPTDMIACEVYGCVLCDYKKALARSDGLQFAPQMHCEICNP